MEIRAGGRRWLVDAHEVEEKGAAAQGFWEVSFRHPEGDEDRVEMRWIPRPTRLTEEVARRLFELAGERLWRDARTGVIYRIHLLCEDRPGDDVDLAEGILRIHFWTGGGSGTTTYDLDRPLGLATDEELSRLADRALEHIPGLPA